MDITNILHFQYVKVIAGIDSLRFKAPVSDIDKISMILSRI
jgi:hypothetical protein